MILSSVILVNIPLSYVALLCGCKPWITMCVSIVLSALAAVVRGYLLKKLLGFPFGRYMIVIFKIAIVSLILLLVCRFFIYGLANNIILVVLWSLMIVLLIIVLYFMILSREDRIFIIEFVKNRITHKNNSTVENV